MRSLSKYVDEPREQIIFAAILSLFLLFVIMATNVIAIDDFNNWMSLFAFVSLIVVTFAASRRGRK